MARLKWLVARERTTITDNKNRKDMSASLDACAREVDAR